MNTPCSRCYGTHDFLAEHALTFLPYEQAYSWLMDIPKSKPNAVFASTEYLYGTELPDRGGSGFKDDHRLHSVYYASDGSLEDDYAAKRAEEYLQQVRDSLRRGYSDLAAMYMGVVSHYLTDVGSYWHVMGKGDDWVDAARNGLAYENWVDGETDRYNSPFASCVSFDGKLEGTSAYDATLKLAYDTTFDTSGSDRTAKWMDDNYDQNWKYYRERVCESLNLSANLLADVIYSVAHPEVQTTTTVTPVITLTQEPTTWTSTTAPTSTLSTQAESLIETFNTGFTTQAAPFAGTEAMVASLVIGAIVLLSLLIVWSRGRSPKASTKPVSVYCVECGADNPSKNEYCGKCGKRLT